MIGSTDMNVYRDYKVQFGGVAVGGIRIRHVSDITRDVTIPLTVTRANRRPYTVKPLPAEQATAPAKPVGPANRTRADLDSDARAAAARGSAALTAFRRDLEPRVDKALAPILDELERTAADADAQADDAGFTGFAPVDVEAA